MTQNAPKILVWDWAIRGFHLLFAGCITMALGIALLGGEHSRWFGWHMVFGIAAGFLLLVRVVLFAVGSRHVRIGALVAALRNLPAFVSGLLGKSDKPTAGHNPLAWLVYLAMFGLLALTVLTGLNADKEWAEEIHPVFAWGLLATIVGHLAGIALHTVRHREAVALSMVTGRKRGPADEALASARPLGGLVLLGVCGLFIGQLFASYNGAAGEVRIPWIGTRVTLGEGEEDEHEEHGRRHHDDDDD
ncbi:MAG: cytochrome b/b6 domain-containing protein [Verrucomicrobiae bacterium]|nr:cytochrome b/b6 domain-containing protein [Verrucomicrobiae bacterium]